jgi:hypothetical protein
MVLSFNEAAIFLNEKIINNELMITLTVNILVGARILPKEFQHLESLGKSNENHLRNGYLIEENCGKPNSVYTTSGDFCLVCAGDELIFPLEDIESVVLLAEDTVRINTQQGYINISWMSQEDLRRFFDQEN